MKRAYDLCHAIITKYGMNEKLGYVGYIENDYSKTYSDATNKVYFLFFFYINKKKRILMMKLKF